MADSKTNTDHQDGSEPLLSVEDLAVSFSTPTQELMVVDGLHFKINSGETLGLVGESGSGKSVTSLALMRLLPYPYGKISRGQVVFQNQDLTALSDKSMYNIRGNQISMIFQEPMTALNPVHRIGKQLAEVFSLHRPELSRRKASEECLQLLKKVGIPSAEQRLEEYPHQLSGGMKQRIMIAMALACQPKLLIADEPTTALDVTTQAQILELMRNMQQEFGMSILFITHDLGVVAQMCDHISVMYAGKILENADVFTLFKDPKHPYTKGLLNSIPTLTTPPKTSLKTIEGVPPQLHELPSGCRFYDRCDHSAEQCLQSSPTLEPINSQSSASVHEVSCFRWRELPA